MPILKWSVRIWLTLGNSVVPCAVPTREMKTSALLTNVRDWENAVAHSQVLAFKFRRYTDNLDFHSFDGWERGHPSSALVTPHS